MTESGSAASPRARLDAFIEWAKSGQGRLIAVSRFEAERILAEIEWGYDAARRELELASQLDAARAKQRELHRRAQKAEADLASVPTFAVLNNALTELHRVKSDRHALRGEVSFMRSERQRLRARISELERELEARASRSDASVSGVRGGN